MPASSDSPYGVNTGLAGKIESHYIGLLIILILISKYIGKFN